MYYALPGLLVAACLINKALFLSGLRHKAFKESNEALDSDYHDVDN